MRIAFLFGAGISIPAGMPRTKDITDKILSGKGIIRSTDGNYYFQEDDIISSNPYTGKIIHYLSLLRDEATRYYNNDNNLSNALINYEDVCYLAVQIRDSITKEFDNPAVLAFREKIINSLQSFFGDEKPNPNTLNKLFDETVNYITCVVCHLLNQTPQQINHLNFIKDAYNDSSVLKIDLFSLNHDLIIENFFRNNSIKIIDGFEESKKGIRYWNSDLYDNFSDKIRLFKLHGSVSWFRYSSKINSDDDAYGIPGENPEIMPIVNSPLILIGTFNKMLAYTSGIYAEIYHKFFQYLPETKYLIISGYSFGDKGINARIIKWLYISSEHKIFIIHPNPEILKKEVRGAISEKWDSWIQNNKLSIIKKKIEEVSWSQIKKIMLTTFPASKKNILNRKEVDCIFSTTADFNTNNIMQD